MHAVLGEWIRLGCRQCHKVSSIRRDVDRHRGIVWRRVSVFPDVTHSNAETRFLAIGRTPTGRHVFVAFTLREQAGGRLIRPISARFMHLKEVKHYEAEIARRKV